MRVDEAASSTERALVDQTQHSEEQGDRPEFLRAGAERNFAALIEWLQVDVEEDDQFVPPPKEENPYEPVRIPYVTTPHKPPHPEYQENITILGKTKYGIEVTRLQFKDNRFLHNGMDAEDFKGEQWWFQVWAKDHERMWNLDAKANAHSYITIDERSELERWRVRNQIKDGIRRHYGNPSASSMSSYRKMWEEGMAEDGVVLQSPIPSSSRRSMASTQGGNVQSARDYDTAVDIPLLDKEISSSEIPDIEVSPPDAGDTPTREEKTTPRRESSAHEFTGQSRTRLLQVPRSGRIGVLGKRLRVYVEGLLRPSKSELKPPKPSLKLKCQTLSDVRSGMDSLRSFKGDVQDKGWDAEALDDSLSYESKGWDAGALDGDMPMYVGCYWNDEAGGLVLDTRERR